MTAAGVTLSRSPHVHAGPLRLLALGDSYTIGEGVPEAGRWPVQLAARLRAEGMPVDPPRLVATTGWTTDELAAAMAASAFDPPYDLVTLLIGVNDQYRGRDLAAYRAGLLPLLEQTIVLAGRRPGRVLVVSIPDWGVTRFGRGSGRDIVQIAAQIDACNALSHAVARDRGAHWVDVTAISREAGDGPGQLTDDGLHPSARQYARWLDAVLPAARQALDTHPAMPPAPPRR